MVRKRVGDRLREVPVKTVAVECCHRAGKKIADNDGWDTSKDWTR